MHCQVCGTESERWLFLHWGLLRREALRVLCPLGPS